MSFTALQHAVLEEATARAALIKSRLNAQQEAEESRLKKAVEDIEKEILARARIEAANQAQQLHQGAVLAARADVLVAKQRALENVRRAFMQQLLEMDEKSAERLMHKLMELVPPTDEGVCYAGEHQQVAVKKAAAKRRFALAEETIPGEGGFIFRSPRLEINLTLGHMADQVLIKHRAAIAAILFA